MLLLVISLWKGILAWKLNIVQDEGYYFYWSLFPQLSYFDHPPLTAWAITIASFLFGDNIWSVRFWPLAVGILFPICGRTLARNIFSEEIANRSGIFLVLCPAFAGNGFFMTPDTLFALFWSIALYSTWKAINNPSSGIYLWVVAGMSAGLGLLSKYNMILYFLGLGVFFVVSPGKRKKLFYGMLLSAGISLIFFIPVLVWNFESDWISFRFQLQHGFYKNVSKPWVTFPDYIGGLLLVATPLLGGLSFWSSARGIFSRDQGRRFLAAFFWTVVLFFSLSAIKHKVQANWAMLAFFSGVILVAADWQFYGKRMRRATVGLLILVIFPPLIYLSFPADFSISMMGRPLDVKRMKEFFGGKDVAKAVKEKKEDLNLDFICIDRHTLLGEIAFYAPELRQLLLLRMRGKYRFPWVDESKWYGKPALLVSKRSESWPNYKKVKPVGKAEIPYKKYLKRTIYFSKGIKYTIDELNLIKTMIELGYKPITR